MPEELFWPAVYIVLPAAVVGIVMATVAGVLLDWGRRA